MDAVEMGGHADEGADGDDAGAADAGDEDVVGVVERREDGVGDGEFGCGGAGALAELAAVDGDEAGAEPSMQEKSLLQDDWSMMRRLVPNSVSTGWTERQLEVRGQSPQASQTASLMKARLLGSGKVPRLRRRRFSLAQVWS